MSRRRDRRRRRQPEHEFWDLHDLPEKHRSPHEEYRRERLRARLWRRVEALRTGGWR